MKRRQPSLGRRLSKQLQSVGRKPSRTSGRDKQENCKASALEKWMAKKSRSYKHPKYQEWKRVKNGFNIKGKIS